MEGLSGFSFNYCVPTEVVFGNGRLAEAGELAARYGKKALLVTGHSGAVKALAEKVMESLKNAGVDAVWFDGVIPNPTTAVISKGAEIAKKEKCQVIIGLGGGSSMDTAKAIAVEAVHEGSAWDYLFYKNRPSEKTLPVIAIGTTAGTGAQTTMIAVLTNEECKDKSAICSPYIFPRIALVDPETTVSMPPSVTAQTGFDAFCHNFESYLSVKESPMGDALSLDAIRRVAVYLPRAVADGNDMEARSQMAWVDTLGGFTNSCAGTTLPHGLGMQISGHCPWVSHGQSLAVLYPSFTRYTRPAAIEKFARVARIFDPGLNSVDDETASMECCRLIDEFLKKIHLWIGFEDLNITKDQIKEIAACGQVLGDYKRNPRIATLEEIYDILMESCKR